MCQFPLLFCRRRARACCRSQPPTARRREPVATCPRATRTRAGRRGWRPRRREPASTAPPRSRAAARDTPTNRVSSGDLPTDYLHDLDLLRTFGVALQRLPHCLSCLVERAPGAEDAGHFRNLRDPRPVALALERGDIRA